MPTIVYADNRSIDAAMAALGENGPTILMLQFDRAEIETAATGSAIDRLMSLGDEPQYVSRLASSCGLVVSGYDADPRELYEIPEVRAFFRKIAHEWGGWLHFLEKDGPSLQVFISFLLDLEVQTREGGVVSTRMRDPEQLRQVLLRLFDGMNELYLHHGLSDESNIAMTDAVMAAVERDLL